MPYALLDERTKKSNRDSLREAVRTFAGYGYNVEPPDQEIGMYIQQESWPFISSQSWETWDAGIDRQSIKYIR